VRDRLDVEPVLVLEHREDVVEGIVEPGVSLGDEESGGRRQLERTDGARWDLG
jgi:hypothetical protein